MRENGIIPNYIFIMTFGYISVETSPVRRGRKILLNIVEYNKCRLSRLL
jgi:hypothetical protein